MKTTARRMAGLAAALILGSLCAMALLGDVLAGAHPFVTSGPEGLSLLPGHAPSEEAWSLWPLVVGDPDAVGETGATLADLFAWWVQGARWTVPSVLLAIGIAFVLGTLLGTPAASGSRGAHAAVARLVEVGGAAPSVVLAWMILSLDLATPRLVLTLLVGLQGAVEVARTITARGGDPDVDAGTRGGRNSGAGPVRTLLHHVMPNTRGAAARSAALAGPGLVALEAALYYLGLLRPSGPSWVTPLVGGAPMPLAVLLAAVSLTALAASIWVLSSRVGRRPGRKGGLRRWQAARA